MMWFKGMAIRSADRFYFGFKSVFDFKWCALRPVTVQACSTCQEVPLTLRGQLYRTFGRMVAKSNVKIYGGYVRLMVRFINGV